MKKVGIAFNTCDRIDFTRQTLPPILAEAYEFDLFWVDGSKTEEGQKYHMTAFPTLAVFERHPNVTGGAVAGIQYSWVTLFNKGYDYIGLIENDVKLSPGWFKKTMALFNIDAKKDPIIAVSPVGGPATRTFIDKKIKVGAASARCFIHRVSEGYPEENFAVMANVGAGMIIFKRELIPTLLTYHRRPALWEVQSLFKYYTGKEYPVPPFILKDDPELKKDWFMSEDWNYELILLSKGYVTLACWPSLAYNLDDPDGFRDPVQRG